MLLNLLPGLRDLRAPLAAGYLWLTAGWLYFAPRLPDSVNDAQGVLKDIYRIVNASSPVAVATALTFVAYILGILSTGLLTRPVRGIAQLPFRLLVSLLSSLTVQGLLEQLISARSTRSRRKMEDLAASSDGMVILSPDEDLLTRSPWDTYRSVYRKLVRLYNPTVLRAEDYVVRRITTSILEDKDYRSTFINRLASEVAKVHPEEFRGKDPDNYEWIGGHLSWREKLRVFDHDEDRIQVQADLSDYIDRGDREAAEALGKCLVDVSRYVDDLMDELPLVPERISGVIGTYERWDRLKAEGEFRQAIVPPLIAIIVALTLRGVLSWPFWLLLIVLPLVILFQGIGKMHAAEAQLMQTIEANITQIASLERLSTTDLHWWSSGASGRWL